MGITELILFIVLSLGIPYVYGRILKGGIIVTDSYTIKTKTGIKELVIVGEVHIYSKEESQNAKKFLDNHNFDFGLFEGVNFGKIVVFIFNIFVEIYKVTTQKNRKSLMILFRDRKIPFIGLEENRTFPIILQVGLAIFIILVFIVYFWVIKLIIYQQWAYLIKLAILIFIGLKYKKIEKLISRVMPFDIADRDNHMNSNLVDILNTRDFRKGLVVVGREHFDKIVETINLNFDVILERKGS